MDAVGTAARAIRAGEAELMIAGGVESMSRAPFVMPKAESAFSRSNAVYDTTIGWRFVNKLMKECTASTRCPRRPRTSPPISGSSARRRTAWRWPASMKGGGGAEGGFFDAEITPVTIAQKKGDPIVVSKDEHPRETSLEALAKLKGVVRPDGTVTAGNASGVNDGACALLLAARRRRGHGLTPRARVVGMATAGVAPRIMGIGPAPGDAQGAAAHRPEARTDRRHRTQRGLRGAGPGGAARSGPDEDDDPRQPERRRHRARPPAGRLGALVTTAINQLHRTAGAMRCAPCASASARASR